MNHQAGWPSGLFCASECHDFEALTTSADNELFQQTSHSSQDGEHEHGMDLLAIFLFAEIQSVAARRHTSAVTDSPRTVRS